MAFPPRTTADKVKNVLGNDYDGTINLAPYIETASVMMDRIVARSNVKNGGKNALTLAEAEMVERWLAAHNYCMMDPTYSSRSTEGASGSFQGTVADGLDGSRYGQQAQRLDPSGCLRNLDKQQFAGAYAPGGPAKRVKPADSPLLEDIG